MTDINENLLRDIGGTGMMHLTWTRRINELSLDLASFLREHENLHLAPHEYRVPEISGDSSCSWNMLPHPFDLKWVFHFNEKSQLRLNRLYSGLHWLQGKCQLDWLGIYQEQANLLIPSYLNDFYGNDPSVPFLVKICYLGAPSRAIFPLNDDYARRSNNCSTYMNRHHALIQDLDQALSQALTYYECDSRVKSELCLPLTSQGSLVGVLDMESFTRDFFVTERVLPCLALAELIDDSGLLS
ncbi:MAG: hypothetical protein IPL83_02855 [Bdellovibrionales bacterium]|nr:hypothetical protein [Bdellovibrionales bacterium]